MTTPSSIIFGDCRVSMRRMIAEKVKVQMCVTSPPYFGLRDYGHAGQLGLETTPSKYISSLVDVFRLVRELLLDDGSLWLIMGDSYSNKNLIGIPWRVAFALQADGWYLRQDIIWHKPNAMPESVRDRCTRSHEYIFLLSKSPQYYFDAEAIKETAVGGIKGGSSSFKRQSSKRGISGVCPISIMPTHRAEREDVRYSGSSRRRRSVWTIATRGYMGAHFATFPTELITPCLLAGSRQGDVVFDPFMGSGTTAQAAILHNRQFLGCELNEDYKVLQTARIKVALKIKAVTP